MKGRACNLPTHLISWAVALLDPVPSGHAATKETIEVEPTGHENKRRKNNLFAYAEFRLTLMFMLKYDERKTLLHS